MAGSPDRQPADDGPRHELLGRSRTAPVPRWVKLAILVLGILVLLAAVAMLLLGGEHGPQRHSGTPRAVIDLR